MNNMPPKYVPGTPLKGSPVSEKQPLGLKIYIIGNRKLKLGMHDFGIVCRRDSIP